MRRKILAFLGASLLLFLSPGTGQHLVDLQNIQAWQNLRDSTVQSSQPSPNFGPKGIYTLPQPATPGLQTNHPATKHAPASETTPYKKQNHQTKLVSAESAIIDDGTIAGKKHGWGDYSTDFP